MLSMGDHAYLALTFRLVFFDQSENIIDIVTWINHHRFASDIVPDDGAIALQGSDWKNFVNHGSGLPKSTSSVVSRQPVISRLTSKVDD